MVLTAAMTSTTTSTIPMANPPTYHMGVSVAAIGATQASRRAAVSIRATRDIACSESWGSCANDKNA